LSINCNSTVRQAKNIPTVSREELLYALEELVPVPECRDTDLLEVLVTHLSQNVHRDLLSVKNLHKHTCAEIIRRKTEPRSKKILLEDLPGPTLSAGDVLIGKYAASRGEKRGLHCRCYFILNIPGNKEKIKKIKYDTLISKKWRRKSMHEGCESEGKKLIFTRGK
jgi:hypothetical protein